MPGLVRGMARTAAVVGTATATRNAVNRRQADKNVAAYTQAVNTATAQAAPPPQEQYYDAARACSRRRCAHPARASGSPQSPGDPHRRGIPGPESQAAWHVSFQTDQAGRAFRCQIYSTKIALLHQLPGFFLQMCWRFNNRNGISMEYRMKGA